MKKNIFALFAAAAILMACNNETEKQGEATAMASPMVAADSTIKDTTATPVAAMADNSANALDWPGTYKGVVPCADCEGIETTIAIATDSAYTLTTKYLGKKNAKPAVKKGKFSWNAAGNTITLAGITNAPSQYLVGENQLIQLDMQGNRITGDMAAKYSLAKQAAAPVAANSLTDTYWKLTELMGKAVTADNYNKEMFVKLLSKENKVQGNSGCNSFFGQYELGKMDRIKFSKMAGTMMACPKMELEPAFLKIFETADSYIIKDNKMQLVRARMAPLAVFEAVPGK
jgi:copper homeostasis protein (lipoprotein)